MVGRDNGIVCMQYMHVHDVGQLVLQQVSQRCRSHNVLYIQYVVTNSAGLRHREGKSLPVVDTVSRRSAVTS